MPTGQSPGSCSKDGKKYSVILFPCLTHVGCHFMHLSHHCEPAVLRVLHNEGAKDPTAYGLHRQMATYSFIAALNLLDDPLSAISRLSHAFQSSNVDLYILQPLLLSRQSRIQ